MRGLVTFTAKHAGRCSKCPGDIIRGDLVSRVYGRSRVILCYQCTKRARGQELLNADARSSAYAHAKRLQTPDE